MGVRVGGLLLFGYLGLLLRSSRCGARSRRGAQRAVPRGLDSGFRVFMPVVAIAYPVMLVFWPWAQRGPIANPLAALAIFSHQNFPFRTLFAGHYIAGRRLPWAYLPVHILLALPELVLLLLVAAPVVALLGCCGAIRRDRPQPHADALHARLRDRLSGRLCDRDQGRAVRRHAAFHFRAAADRRVAALVADRALAGSPRRSWRHRRTPRSALYGVAHVG